MNKNLVFVVNNAAFFVSHRLPIAIHAKKVGYQVSLVTGHSGSDTLEKSALQILHDQEIKHYKVAFRSAGMNVFIEIYGLMQLIFVLLKLKPAIVHCASPKGVLYGGIAARLANTPSLVLAITGMGYGFTNTKDKKDAIRRSIVKRLFLVLLNFIYKHKNKKIIVQNLDDKALAEDHHFVNNTDVILIKGSGVNLNNYRNISLSSKEKLIVLPARMLQDKGIIEFYMTAKQLKIQGCEWRFVLAGTADYKNPSSIHKDVIEAWVLEGIVEWLGHVDDMPALYKKASVVCLPSYREGMSKALLEASAAGCAIITTDVIGCRESIVPGFNGDLAEAKSVDSLIFSIKTLIDNPERIRRYGINSQKLAEDLYDINMVIDKTMSIYVELNSNLGLIKNG